MPLLSRSLDPLLAVFTGVMAYKLYETNPRTAPPPDETLGALLSWKLAQWKAERQQRERVVQEAWENEVKHLRQDSP